MNRPGAEAMGQPKVVSAKADSLGWAFFAIGYRCSGVVDSVGTIDEKLSINRRMLHESGRVMERPLTPPAGP